MASPVISNPVTNTDRSRDSKRKKKKAQMKHQQQDSHSHAKWKFQAQQQIYSSKLHQALSRVNNGSASPRGGSKAVREAADGVLAATAEGRTQWSRAILTYWLKLKFRKQKHERNRLIAIR